MSAWISENAFDVKKRAIAIATCHTMTLVGALIASRKLTCAARLCNDMTDSDWSQRNLSG